MKMVRFMERLGIFSHLSKIIAIIAFRAMTILGKLIRIVIGLYITTSLKLLVGIKSDMPKEC